MPVVTYSALRLGLFAVALLGLWLAGMGGWLLVVVAALVAFALSYVLLRRQRDAAASWLATRRTGVDPRPRFSRAVEDDAAAEDAAADRLRPERVGSPDPREGAEPPAAGGESDGGPDQRDDGGPGQIARPSPSSTP